MFSDFASASDDDKLNTMTPVFSLTKSDNLQLGLMMFLFCFANLLLITASQQLDGNSHLGDGNVDVNSIASDLQSGNRGVFAVGYVSDKLTLFVSGPGSHRNPSGGFQVAVEEAADGVFKISSAPVPVPSGIPSNADVKFVCKDSSGDNLVAMSNNEIGTILLPSGSYEKADALNDDSFCYHKGSLHLSSFDAGNFYAILPQNGIFRKFSFDNKSIKASELCNTYYTFGQLCINEKSISFKDKCDGTVPSGIISGSVGSSNVYLFDDSNTVYAFEATVFINKQSAKLTKKSKEEAFVGQVKPSTATVPQETTSQSKVLLFSLIFIVVTIVLAILIPLICCYCKPFAELWQKKKSKNPKSFQKSTQKGGTSGRHVKGGGSRTSSPKKMTATSDRSKSKSKAASPQSKQS